MGKAATFFKLIRIILNEPKSLLKVLDEDEFYRKQLLKSHSEFQYGLPLLDILELFPNLNEKIEYGFLDGTSFPLDLVLLKKLAARFTDCTYMEIGTWRGESVATVAVAAKECFTVNLPDEAMRKAGLPDSYINSHRFFSKNLNNVTHIQANSHTFDFHSLKKKFDLIFIDGDHHYKSVEKDTQTLFPFLRDENSIMVWHDYTFNPEKIRYEVLAGILSGLPAEARKHLYYVSNTLCAVYMKGTIKSSAFEPYQLPGKKFFLHISSSRCDGEAR